MGASGAANREQALSVGNVGGQGEPKRKLLVTRTTALTHYRNVCPTFRAYLQFHRRFAFQNGWLTLQPLINLNITQSILHLLVLQRWAFFHLSRLYVKDVAGKGVFLTSIRAFCLTCKVLTYISALVCLCMRPHPLSCRGAAGLCPASLCYAGKASPTLAMPCDCRY